jgi:hypothetical protein
MRRNYGRVDQSISSVDYCAPVRMCANPSGRASRFASVRVGARAGVTQIVTQLSIRSDAPNARSHAGAAA